MVLFAHIFVISFFFLVSMLIEGLKSYSIVQKILKRGVHHLPKSRMLGLNLFPVSLEIVRGFLPLYKTMRGDFI